MRANCRRILKFRAAHRENFPERIAQALKPARDAGLLPSFPFGSDFTEVEQRLIPALQLLQEAQRTPLRLPGLLWQGFYRSRRMPPNRECLARLGLDRPDDICRARLSRAGQRGAGAERNSECRRVGKAQRAHHCSRWSG